VRDGARAREYAARVCERTGWPVAGFLDTLAEEMDWAEYQGHRDLYHQGKPYREG
jgi:hypothetical protein